MRQVVIILCIVSCFSLPFLNDVELGYLHRRLQLGFHGLKASCHAAAQAECEKEHRGERCKIMVIYPVFHYIKTKYSCLNIIPLIVKKLCHSGF